MPRGATPSLPELVHPQPQASRRSTPAAASPVRSPRQAKTGQIAAVQHLRWFAAAAVLYGHVVHEAGERFAAAPDPDKMPRLLDWGIGVDVFFVISGFVIFLTSSTRFGEPGFARVFLQRRFERVAPLYWIFTSLMLVATLVIPGAVTHNGSDLLHVASSYLFLPWPRLDEQLRPVLALGWTLNFEMFFYLMFSGALLLPRRLGPTVLVGILLGGVALHSFLPESWWILRFWTDPFVLEFLAGMGVARLYQLGVRLPRGVALVAIIGSAVLAVVFTRLHLESAVLRTGLPAMLFAAAWILSPGLLPEGRLSQTLSFGGEASYALYLSHPFALNLVALVWTRLGLEAPALFIALNCAVALLVGALVHVLVERPLMAWVRTPRTLKPAWEQLQIESRRVGAWIEPVVRQARTRSRRMSAGRRPRPGARPHTGAVPERVK